MDRLYPLLFLSLLIYWGCEDKKDDKSWWYARAVRSEMLYTGVWAISDREENIRMYPALNMDKGNLLKGLKIMENAIATINSYGQDLGDSPPWPTGYGPNGDF